MGEQTEVRYETRGELTEDLVREIVRGMTMPGYLQKVLKVCGVTIAVCLVAILGISIFDNDWANWQYVLPGAFCFVLIPIMLHRLEDVSVRRFQEQVPGGRCVMRCGFTEAGVLGENETTGGRSVIEYRHLKRLYKVQNVWVLLTKTQQFLVLFQEELLQTDRESLLRMLKEKCPKIKITV